MSINRYWDKATASGYGSSADFELQPAKSALLIVDMQNYDAHRDHAYGLLFRTLNPPFYEYFFNRLEQVVVPANARLLSFFREHHLRVIFITVGAVLPDWSDFSPRRRKRYMHWLSALPPGTPGHKGTVEHNILEAIKPVEGELVINKTTSSAFNSTGLRQDLLNLGITDLVITGVATDACVEMTARDAADLGYNCVLVEDACGCPDPESQESTIKQYARQSGRVETTVGVIEELLRGLK